MVARNLLLLHYFARLPSGSCLIIFANLIKCCQCHTTFIQMSMPCDFSETLCIFLEVIGSRQSRLTRSMQKGDNWLMGVSFVCCCRSQPTTTMASFASRHGVTEEFAGCNRHKKTNTGISSEIRTKLRDWAIWQARAGCYS